MINTTNAIPMLTPRELGSLLRLHADTVRKAARAGLLPHVKIGGAIRFSGEHIEAIMRDGFALPKKTN